MSNAYSSVGKVWKVDEAGALNTGGVTVTDIVFVPHAASDVLTLSDASGNLLYQLTAPGTAIIPHPLSKPRRWPSLTVTTLTSGAYAYIYFDRSKEN